MILSCPACAAQFVVDPRALGSTGRKVRCSKCRHEWQASAPLITQPADLQPLPQSVKPIPAGSALPAMSAAAAASGIPLGRSAGLAAMAAFLLVLPFFALKIGPHLAVRHAQEEKMEAVGLEGVPTTMLREEEGRTVLSIEGVLVNRSGGVQKVPGLKASALDARGHVVREWAIPLSAAQLEAGQRLPFSFSAPLSEQGVEDIAFHLL
ncbi:MAG: zinc-ribbon domain-containing protein [Proteobacteria bacterium]|nr:zinc-ribbon domain-containing protein [Pseudomonadota bacterium]